MANYTENWKKYEDTERLQSERLQSESNYQERSITRISRVVHSILIPKRWRKSTKNDEKYISGQLNMKVTPVLDISIKADEQVCLLSQSPYRILKVGFFLLSFF